MNIKHDVFVLMDTAKANRIDSDIGRHERKFLDSNHETQVIVCDNKPINFLE